MGAVSTHLTISGNSAAGLLDAAWSFLDGKTDGGWSWAREDAAGVTVAVYGEQSCGGGRKRWVWLAGNAAGSTPGLLATDTAAAQRVFLGAGESASGNTWQGWTSSTPLGSGGVGRCWGLVTAGATTAVKVLVAVGVYGLACRVEGNAVDSTTRVGIAGGWSRALDPATAAADGRHTLVWASGHSAALNSAWTAAAANSGVAFTHFGSDGQSHGAAVLSGSLTAVQARLPAWPGSDSAVSGGRYYLWPAIWQVVSSGQIVGHVAAGSDARSSSTTAVSVGGIPVAVEIRRRQDGGASSEGVILPLEET